jgi:hypothetical protein
MDWEPEKAIVVANQDVYFWTIPAPRNR